MSSEFHRMSENQLTAVLYSACFNWGAYRAGSILEIQEIYREFGSRVGERERLATLVKLAEEARKHGAAFNSLVPFMWEDPSISVVISATIEFASSAPPESEDELTGPRIVVGMINNAASLPKLNRAGMIKGLLMLGDRRVLPLLGDAWNFIDAETMVSFLTTGTGFVYQSWIDFLLKWAESVDPETDPCYGAVAHILFQIPEATISSMEGRILDVERPYPITLGEIKRVGEWTVPQVAEKLKGCFQRLAARETTEPVLMERVMEAWGLPELHEVSAGQSLGSGWAPHLQDVSSSVPRSKKSEEVEMENPTAGAFPDWQAALKAGDDAAAQCRVGLMYAAGEGVPQDYIVALKWLRLAAEKGYAQAQCSIGVLYANGQGVPQDDPEAVKWFRKAAGQGYMDGQYYLGVAYEASEGVQRDYAEAARWYQLAADQGHAAAQRRLGLMCVNGHGVSQDYAQALKWFRLAAEQGNAPAQCSVGVSYASGQGVPQDYAEAVKWFLKASEQGDAGGQHYLGVAYENGHGVQRDYLVAVKWYRLAADQGDAEAQFNLGMLYDNGLGVPQDAAVAAAWYRLASDHGHAKAQFNLGAMFDSGEGVPQDYAEAAKWFRKAAEQGLAIAQYTLGAAYTERRGVPLDEAEAVRWYRLGAEQGCADAQFSLGEMYESGRGVQVDHVAAVRWYRLAADQGHSGAQRRLK